MWIFGGLTPQACPNSIASCCCSSCCCCIFIHCAQLIRCTFSSSKCQLLLLLLHRLHKSRQPQPAQRGGRGNCYCLAAICRECQRDHKPQTDLRRKRLKLRGDLLLLMLSCKRKGNRIANIATRYKTLKLKKMKVQSIFHFHFHLKVVTRLCCAAASSITHDYFAFVCLIYQHNNGATPWPRWVSLLNSSPFTNNRKICV